MKKSYKLNTTSFDEKRKAILKRGIFISIIAVSGGFTISTINTGFDWKVLLIMIPIAAFAIFIGLRRGIKMQKEAWESYEIKWDSNTITRSQIRTKDVSINKIEITEIDDSENGIILKTNDKSISIFIPKELDYFAELVKELKA